MWTGKFDPHAIMVPIAGLLHGPLGSFNIHCVLDTGAPFTVINTAVADQLGYNARMGKRRVRLWGIGTPQEGYSVEVSRFEAMGLCLSSFEIVCEDLDPHFGIEGLIGLDLLARHILTLDFITGTIALGP